MHLPISRRRFLRQAVSLATAGAAIGAVEGAGFASALMAQHDTWAEASRPNEEFLSRHAARLRRLTLGGSFAPEQWPLGPGGQAEAMQGLDFAFRELGMRQLRLGLRWNRSVDTKGNVDLKAYRPTLDYCFDNAVDVCLNPGPVRVFRWPEEHVPFSLLENLPTLPTVNSTIGLESALAQAAFDYLERLLKTLQAEYGSALAQIKLVQLENEPFYPLGAHRWRFAQSYLVSVAERVRRALPQAALLVTSAGRLNLDDVSRLFTGLQAKEPSLRGRLVSGFDFHYKTPLRDSIPVIRHLDQITYGQPFSTTTEQHIRASHAMGFRIEVTEAQAEPYAQFTTPGNSAHDFRFLILRLLDKVLDSESPGLIRIWGVEELSKRFLRGEATEDHRQILEIIQSVNALQPAPLDPVLAR